MVSGGSGYCPKTIILRDSRYHPPPWPSAVESIQKARLANQALSRGPSPKRDTGCSDQFAGTAVTHRVSVCEGASFPDLVSLPRIRNAPHREAVISPWIWWAFLSLCSTGTVKKITSRPSTNFLTLLRLHGDLDSQNGHGEVFTLSSKPLPTVTAQLEKPGKERRRFTNVASSSAWVVVLSVTRVHRGASLGRIASR
jgi:hypothetical protein